MVAGHQMGQKAWRQMQLCLDVPCKLNTGVSGRAVGSTVTLMATERDVKKIFDVRN